MSNVNIYLIAALVICSIYLNTANPIIDKDVDTNNNIVERGITEWRFKRLMDRMNGGKATVNVANDDVNDIESFNLYQQIKHETVHNDYMIYKTLLGLLKKLSKQ